MGFADMIGSLPGPGTFISMIPGKMERQYRQDIMADRERLAGGRGGMSPAELQRKQAEANAAIQGQLNQQMAAMARGSASGSGASGMQQAQMRNLQASGLKAQNQAMSDIRGMDLKTAQALRDQLMQRQLAARQMGMQRREQGLSSLSAGFQGGGEAGGIQQQQNIDTAASGAQGIGG